MVSLYEIFMCRVKPRIAKRFSSDHERTLQVRLRAADVEESYRDHDTVITALKAENKGENAIN